MRKSKNLLLDLYLVYFLSKSNGRIKSKKAFKEIRVQIRGSTSKPREHGGEPRKGEKRYITGIISEGCIPNLIKKKSEEINNDS